VQAEPAIEGCAPWKTAVASALLSARVFEGSNGQVITGQRTAKWTAITDRLAGTHGHFRALSSQVGVTNALADGVLYLHGMQEARGSSPLSSTRSTRSGPKSQTYGWSFKIV
jgi:hypothetical protein